MGDELIKETTSTDDGYRQIRPNEDRLNRFTAELSEAMKMTYAKRMVKLEDMHESTSDFPILLGGVINRMLMGAYSAVTPVWRKFTRVRTTNDFRSFEIVKTWGTSTLDAIKELAEYKAFARSEGKYSGSLAKYGKKYGISWEMLINDNLGGFGDIANVLSQMALKTEWKLVTELICDASGPKSTLFGATVSDAADSTAITNLGALPLTIANLETTLSNMKSQLDANSEPMMIMPRYLVVPPALEYTARVILTSGVVFATGLASTSSSTLRGQTNVIPQEGLELVVNPWLPLVDVSAKKNTTWYVFSDGQVPAIQMTYLQGYEAPQLAIKSNSIQGGSPTDGSFEDDSIWYRVRHVMGPITLDPRGAYAQTGS